MNLPIINRNKFFSTYISNLLAIVIITCNKDNVSTTLPIASISIAHSYVHNIATTSLDSIGLKSFLSDSIDSNHSSLIYLNLFDEDGTIPTVPLSKSSGLTNESSRIGAISLTNSIVRSGRSAVKFEYLKNDAAIYNSSNPNAYLYQRAELARPSETEVEQWYGFSNYFPDSYISDPVPELVFQWHDLPDWNSGEHWRAPPLAMITQNNRFKFKVRHTDKKVNTNSTANQIDFDLGTIIKNKWIDWVIHIKFSHGQDGVLEVWKNGLKVINYTGPNSYNDARLPYFKIGIYKWDWTESPKSRNQSPQNGRILYYDALKIGNGNANYYDVAPD